MVAEVAVLEMIVALTKTWVAMVGEMMARGVVGELVQVISNLNVIFIVFHQTMNSFTSAK